MEEAFPRSSVRRRQLLIGAAALWPVSCVAGHARAAEQRHAASPALLATLCDIVMPTTDTPGAKDAKVPAFVETALAHGLFGGDAGTAGALERVLDARAGGSGFLPAAVGRQREVVAALDRETYARATAPVAISTSQAGSASATQAQGPAEPEPNRLWRVMKTAIVVGYYTSEPGASVELSYDLVPGRFDPDIPVPAGGGYLSNNWIANLG